MGWVGREADLSLELVALDGAAAERNANAEEGGELQTNASGLKCMSTGSGASTEGSSKRSKVRGGTGPAAGQATELLFSRTPPKLSARAVAKAIGLATNKVRKTLRVTLHKKRHFEGRMWGE